MSQGPVRDLDEERARLLKRHTAAHNRPAESGHRAILDAALRPNNEPF